MNKGLQHVKRSLEAANEQHIDKPGNYVWFLSGSGPIMLAFDDGPWGEYQVRDGVPYAEFRRVSVRSEIEQNVVLAVGEITTATPVQSFAEFAGTISAVFDVPNDFQGLAEVTIGAGLTVPLVAADPARLSLRVHMPSSAADAETEGDPARVYVASPGTVADGVGALIEPGVAERIGGTGALSAHNPTDQPITVNLLASRKVA